MSIQQNEQEESAYSSEEVQEDVAASRDSSTTYRKPADVSESSISIQLANGEILDSEATIISNAPPMQPLPDAPFLRPRELGKALEGKNLDHFTLLEFIGGGGMGAVFRAHDTQLDRQVAVKVLAAERSGDIDTRQRFRNEALSAARLDHENIARVHYVGRDHNVDYIVFEFIPGTNVRDLVLSQGTLSLEQALGYTLQISEALAHAWRRGVVHRDIKPSNILITQDHIAKVVDMGLARMSQVREGEGELTESGMTLGTFDYISPEQARDPRFADTRSDIYSLGCTLYFMLCGQAPFPEGTVLQKLLQHQSEAAPDPRAIRHDLPVEVSQLVAKMLAKSPDDRYQSPTELIAAIASLSDKLGISLLSARTSVPLIVNSSTESLLVRHLPWLVPLVLLLAGVFVIELYDRSNLDTENRKGLMPVGVFEGTSGAEGAEVDTQDRRSPSAASIATPLSTSDDPTKSIDEPMDLFPAD